MRKFPVQESSIDIVLPTPRFTSIPVKEILDHNIDRIKELVEAHTTTLVFVNTRNMTETFVQRLKVAGLEGVEGHHGSMDKTIRLDVEQRLKEGRLRCVVSSSSLEMGIDIGSVISVWLDLLVPSLLLCKVDWSPSRRSS